MQFYAKLNFVKLMGADFGKFQNFRVKRKIYKNHTFTLHSILTPPMQGKQVLGKKSYQSKM